MNRDWNETKKELRERCQRYRAAWKSASAQAAALTEELAGRLAMPPSCEHCKELKSRWAEAIAERARLLREREEILRVRNQFCRERDAALKAGAEGLKNLMDARRWADEAVQAAGKAKQAEAEGLKDLTEARRWADEERERSAHLAVELASTREQLSRAEDQRRRAEESLANHSAA